jgi:hypothetical protein
MASITWKLRQGGAWRTASDVMPAESASRVGCQLLRLFLPAGSKGARLTPADLDVTEDIKRFTYNSDTLVLILRRVRTKGSAE